MIKAVIFDCFGVMIMPGRTLLYQEFPELASQISRLERRSDAGDMEHSEFIQAISELTGIEASEIDEKYYDVTGYHTTMIEWAHELKKTGKYKIAMISNIGHDWINEFFELESIQGLFDEVILSCDVNILKPDPAIFTMMAEKLALSPSECVMIDDLPRNINGAKKAGMQGVLFTSSLQTKEDFYNLERQ